MTEQEKTAQIAVVRQLNRLIQLDVDASLAYYQATSNIEEEDIALALEGFREDHERHILELTAEVKSFGGEPISPKRDIKGFFIEGFTAIRSILGTEGALKAMRSNEHLSTRTYEKALASDLPPSSYILVRQGFEDEQRHLRHIDGMIERRVWERPLRDAI